MANPKKNINKIRKKNGSVVDFDQNKIFQNVSIIMKFHGVMEKGSAKAIADIVTFMLEDKFWPFTIPSTDQIQDLIEGVLMKMGWFEIAKSYILNRNMQKALKEAEKGDRKESPNKIKRALEFPPEFLQAGVSILHYFASFLNKKYPDKKVKVSIEQDGLKVSLNIITEKGEREIIEKDLNDYGLVVTGKMAIEEFTKDRDQSIELRQQLRIAKLHIETQRELLHEKNLRIDELNIFLLKALEVKSSTPIAISFESSQKTESSAYVKSSQVQSQQVRTLNVNKIDPIALAKELKKLSNAMDKEAKNQKQYKSVKEVILAEQAAEKGDRSTALKHLKNAGKWALYVATEIGTNLVIEVFKYKLGLK